MSTGDPNLKPGCRYCSPGRSQTQLQQCKTTCYGENKDNENKDKTALCSSGSPHPKPGCRYCSPEPYKTGRFGRAPMDGFTACSGERYLQRGERSHYFRRSPTAKLPYSSHLNFPLSNSQRHSLHRSAHCITSKVGARDSGQRADSLSYKFKREEYR